MPIFENCHGPRSKGSISCVLDRVSLPKESSWVDLMGDGLSRAQVEEDLARMDAIWRHQHERSGPALAAIDEKTRMSHLLIVLKSMGFVEIQGKDSGGIYQKLDQWLCNNWHVKKVERSWTRVADDDPECCGCECWGYASHVELVQTQDHHRLCGMRYSFAEVQDTGAPTHSDVYRSKDGKNNLGKLAMQIANFMTHASGWALQFCDRSTLGAPSNYSCGMGVPHTEQQIKFKATSTSQTAPLIMIELRQEGYIQMNGPDSDGIYEKLAEFLTSKWSASKHDADLLYCDAEFSTSAFTQQGSENNMDKRTMELLDFMVKQCQWTLVSCKDLQLVFRKDEIMLHSVDNLMIDLNGVKINGLHNAEDLEPDLTNLLITEFGCKRSTELFCLPWGKQKKKEKESVCDLRLTCPAHFLDPYPDSGVLATNLGKLTIRLADLLGSHGWALLLVNHSKLFFTRAISKEKAQSPLLFIEFRTVPLGHRPVEYVGHIDICGPDTNGVYNKLHTFLVEKMDAFPSESATSGHCDRTYHCGRFLIAGARGGFSVVGTAGEGGSYSPLGGFLRGESSMGKWSTRLCDFMVDHLGEWELIAYNSCNPGRAFTVWTDKNGNEMTNYVNARQAQMIFRHRTGGQVLLPPEMEEPPQAEEMRG